MSICRMEILAILKKFLCLHCFSLFHCVYHNVINLIRVSVRVDFLKKFFVYLVSEHS
jgi:hypothetical protein